MAKYVIEVFDDGNDVNGVRLHRVKGFNTLVFDSEEAACLKLDAMESERRREDAATPFSFRLIALICSSVR